MPLPLPLTGRPIGPVGVRLLADFSLRSVRPEPVEGQTQGHGASLRNAHSVVSPPEDQRLRSGCSGCGVKRLWGQSGCGVKSLIYPGAVEGCGVKSLRVVG